MRFHRKMNQELPNHAVRLRLNLQKTRVLPNTLKRACARSIFHHILYSRDVLPCQCPLDELLESCKATNLVLKEHTPPQLKRKLSITRAERVVRKHGLKLQESLHDFETVFNLTSRDSIKAVLFTLGPSFASPREQYLIRFIPQLEETLLPESFVPENLSKLEKEISRRTVRLFLQASLSDDSFESSRKRNRKSTSSRKINIAFFLSPSACNLMFDNIADGQNEVSFQAKHHFQVKVPRMISSRKKQVHRPFVIFDVVPASSSPPPNSTMSDDSTLGQGQWITLTKAIQSFRLNK